MFFKKIARLFYYYVPSHAGGWASSFLRLLIGRSAVPINLEISNGIAVLAALIAGVAFYGVDAPILDLLDNANMVG